MLSDERLAEIEARVDAATPGPWQSVYEYPYDSAAAGRIRAFRSSSPDVLMTVHERYVGHQTSDQHEATATFVAHAREDIPDLLTEVRRLRRENHLLSLSRGIPSTVGLD